MYPAVSVSILICVTVTFYSRGICYWENVPVEEHLPSLFIIAIYLIIAKICYKEFSCLVIFNFTVVSLSDML